jgi:hypothetical protein
VKFNIQAWHCPSGNWIHDRADSKIFRSGSPACTQTLVSSKNNPIAVLNKFKEKCEVWKAKPLFNLTIHVKKYALA